MATQAERKKIAKYSSLDSSYQFIPVAVETGGTFGPKTHELVSELGRRVRRVTLEENSHQYLVQRIAIAVQRGNAASVLGSLGSQTSC